MRRILSPARSGAAAVFAASLIAAACGGDDGSGGDAGQGAEGPTIVVTTSVWGDIVGNAFGEVADVQTIIPVGADPHDFAPSARQAEQLENADLVIVNGLGLESGMTSLIERVADTGAEVVAVGELSTPIESEAGGDDPHVWLDPSRVAGALTALAEPVAAAGGLDGAVVDEALGGYLDELAALDAEIDAALAPIEPGRRLLVTDHDSFAYFADHYGFEVVGTVIGSNSTTASASAAHLEDLAQLMRDRGVLAVFAESSTPDRLARSLAAEVGDEVAVVELYVGSLGGPESDADTYLGLMRVNADRIAAALAAP